jgi:hypothetical protein
MRFVLPISKDLKQSKHEVGASFCRSIVGFQSLVKEIRPGVPLEAPAVKAFLDGWGAVNADRAAMEEVLDAAEAELDDFLAGMEAKDSYDKLVKLIRRKWMAAIDGAREKIQTCLDAWADHVDKLGRKPVVGERWLEKALDTSIDVTLFMGCLPDEITIKKGELFG